MPKSRQTQAQANPSPRRGQSPPTIVVFGDSQAAGLARGLQRMLAEDPRFRVLNRTHPGASLIHDEHEWLAPVAEFAEREKADIAVVMFGANDRLDMREGRTTLRFRSAEWRAEYTARIDKILDRLRRRRAARAVARQPDRAQRALQRRI